MIGNLRAWNAESSGTDVLSYSVVANRSAVAQKTQMAAPDSVRSSTEPKVAAGPQQNPASAKKTWFYKKKLGFTKCTYARLPGFTACDACEASRWSGSACTLKPNAGLSS